MAAHQLQQYRRWFLFAWCDAFEKKEIIETFENSEWMMDKLKMFLFNVLYHGLIFMISLYLFIFLFRCSPCIHPREDMLMKVE